MCAHSIYAAAAHICMLGCAAACANEECSRRKGSGTVLLQLCIAAAGSDLCCPLGLRDGAAAVRDESCSWPGVEADEGQPSPPCLFGITSWEMSAGMEEL